MVDESLETSLTESHVLELFVKLGYRYLEPKRIETLRESADDVVLTKYMKEMIKRLNPLLDTAGAVKAGREIIAVKGESLMDINRKVHRMLIDQEVRQSRFRFGVRMDFRVSYIDFRNIRVNDFVITDHVRYRGTGGEMTVDFVVYINGLPLGVLTYKASSGCTLSGAVRELNNYRENCEKLFYYNQVCAAICKDETAYGPVGAGLEGYHAFKSTDNTELEQLLEREATPRDILIYNLFKKENFLEIIRNFIIYRDKEGKPAKMLARYHQLRAVNKVAAVIRRGGKGGVIYQTPGSGKTATMLFLSRKLCREEREGENPTFVIMTGSSETEQRIIAALVGCSLDRPSRTKSITSLAVAINRKSDKIITVTLDRFRDTDERSFLYREPLGYDENGTKTVVNRKFNETGELVKFTTVKDREGRILSELEEIVPIPLMTTRREVYVLLGEDVPAAHYAFLANFMRRALPNACFIAFTGVPLDERSKTLLGEYYGGAYLDSYTSREAKEEGMILPVFYEPGVPVFREKKEPEKKKRATKKWRKVKKLDEDERKKRKRNDIYWNKQIQLESYLKIHPRIEAVARHIIAHYKTRVFPDRYKGMVVVSSREDAVAYAGVFNRLAEEGLHSFRTPLIMSLKKQRDPMIYFEIATPPDAIAKKAERFTHPFGNKKNMPREEKKFYNNDALLIVYDILADTYDVPVVQALYLDRILDARSLIYVAARVNRVRSGKEAGYIIDYSGTTRHLAQTLEIHGEELSLEDVMEPRGAEIPRLELKHRRLKEFFAHIAANPAAPSVARERFIEQAVLYLEDPEKRDEFRDLVNRYNRSLRVVNPEPGVGEGLDDFLLYNEIRHQADNIYEEPGSVQIGLASRALGKILEEHLKILGRQYLLSKPSGDIDSEEFRQELEHTPGQLAVIKKYHRLRRYIREHQGKNPGETQPLAERLEETMERIRRENLPCRDVDAGMKALAEIREELIKKSREAKDRGFAGEGEYEVFKRLRERSIQEEAAREITGRVFGETVEERQYPDWDRKNQVKRDISRKIKFILKDYMGAAEIQTLGRELLHIMIDNKETRQGTSS